ncbi:MAG: benzoyl-CoA-dihydrodiol lyase [Deltaproteobacteria bacterium]|nr:MAG: benzoyl-CoA-dihydrodiol lyase [Deltaproteobacteria bacterium]
MGKHEKFQPIESFETHPDRYKHWKLSIDGAIATLALCIEETNGMRDDYLLKLNSYDVGVDIELRDAVERLRFEHPQVTAVVVTSDLPRIFCAGANIKMLATSTHGFKVNFCKYTNETRGGLEEASRECGITFIAACNGTASGGGYELAEACDEIYLIDDGSSAVSLPEVPLLGVLPGTGGLTRLVDKRKVRRDIADVFCTKAEGFRARDAVKYHIVDGSFPRSKWDDGIAKKAEEAAARHGARAESGVVLTPLTVEVGENTRSYQSVDLSFDPETRVATITVKAPTEPAPADAAALMAEGANSWSFRVWRELHDALLHLRFNHPTVGLILFKTEGDADAVLAHDAVVLGNQDDWYASEVRRFQARVLRAVDNTSRSMFALIEEGSCFVGSLFELTLACDRSYMLEDEDGEVAIRVTEASAGAYPMATGMTRLTCRFQLEPELVTQALEHGAAIDAPEAFDMGLVTLAPDDIDWEDEVRIAIEERASLSPDALTGMEQNLRFVGPENADCKVYGRLSAWQNWIFQRPNAVGDEGALTLFGHPERPSFDWRRT